LLLSLPWRERVRVRGKAGVRHDPVSEKFSVVMPATPPEAILAIRRHSGGKDHR
jgi:hypothetical protein